MIKKKEKSNFRTYKNINNNIENLIVRFEKTYFIVLFFFFFFKIISWSKFFKILT